MPQVNVPGSSLCIPERKTHSVQVNCNTEFEPMMQGLIISSKFTGNLDLGPTQEADHYLEIF